MENNIAKYLDFKSLKQNSAEIAKIINYKKIGKLNFREFNFENQSLLVDNVDDKKYIKLLINKYKKIKNTIIFVNGKIVFKNVSNIEKYIKIDIFNSNSDINDVNNKIFTDYLKSNSDDKLSALNKAKLNSGLIFAVKGNAKLVSPLLLIIGANKNISNYLYINMECNAELKIIQKNDFAEGINVSSVLNITSNYSSKLDYVSFDTNKPYASKYFKVNATLLENAELKLSGADFNECDTLNDIDIKLIGEKAHAETKNINYTSGNNKYVHSINIEHLAKSTTSNILNNGVAGGRALVYIEGTNKINKGMSDSNANQQTKVITLSDNVKVTANPYLIIDEYNVEASHGAAVGQIDEDELYYLMSRGLTKGEAQKLIVSGFLRSVTQEVCLKEIKNELENTIQQKLDSQE